MEEVKFSEAFYKVDALLTEQREVAYEKAKLIVAGKKPESGVDSNVIQEYSRELLRMIDWMVNIVLVSAFIPSAFRIYYAAQITYMLGVDNYVVSVIVGVVFVMLAEFGQIAFVMHKEIDKEHPRLLLIGVILCTLIALVGNAHVSKIQEHPSLFGVLETFAPPLIVLIGANVKKSIYMKKDKVNHQIKTEYIERKETWQEKYENAHKQEGWDRVLAIQIYDAIRNNNKNKKAVLRDLTKADRWGLVMRERKAEEWWDEAEAEFGQTDNRQTDDKNKVSVMSGQTDRQTTNTGQTYTDRQHTDNRQTAYGYNKTADGQQRMIEYLSVYPDKALLGSRPLSEAIYNDWNVKIGHDTANKARNAWRHIPEEELQSIRDRVLQNTVLSNGHGNHTNGE